MKKTVIVLAAFAAVLLTACSGLFESGAVTKSDGISCTIDASSLAQLPGARAASSSFTIALTMKNSSSGATIQDVSATCTAGGSCTLSFEPVATGSKVVVTGTVAYNGTTVGTVSSEEHTITESTNPISLTITALYPVTCSVDLSSFGISNSGTITLTLKNNSDNTTQTKQVDGALNGAQTVTFATAVANGTSVTASGYVTYDSKVVYYFANKTFTVTSATGTVSMSGAEAQTLTYGCASQSNEDEIAISITYIMRGTKTVTSTDVLTYGGVSNIECMSSTISSDGQIYIAFAGDNDIYYLYTDAARYTITFETTPDVNRLACCTLADGSLLLSTGTALYHLVASGTSSYTATALSFTAAYDIRSMRAVTINGTQYVFYSYTNTSAEFAYKPVLRVASFDGATMTDLGGCTISSGNLLSSDTSTFRSNVCIADMAVVNGTFYALFDDQPIKYVKYVYGSTMPLTSRGALLSADATLAVTALSAGTLPSFTVRGWTSTAATVYGYYSPSYYSCPYYGSQSTTYNDGFFAGPQRFIAIKPDVLTMADYGIYISSVGSDSTAGQYHLKNGTAQFDLSALSLSFTRITDNDFTYYGVDGSGLGASGSVMYYCNY